MTVVLVDIETDGLNPTVIHCIVCKVKGKVYKFTGDLSGFSEFVDAIDSPMWVFHNGLSFDVPVINRLTNVNIPLDKVVDVFVVSRLKDFNKYSTHSLKELGQDLGVYKGDYNGGWDEYSEEMLEYCAQDVEVLEAIFNSQKKFIFDPTQKEALRLEHDITVLCNEMTENGFEFDSELAQKALKNVKRDMSTLEKGFKKFIGSRVVLDRRLKLKYKKDGDLYTNCMNTILNTPEHLQEIEGEELLVYKEVPFNPGSPKQRIDILWEYGWKPTEKTKGHIKRERENRKWKRKY